ncbi:hypothetical protein ACFRCX_28050 [Streptomyces sp. NPDC056652]
MPLSSAPGPRRRTPVKDAEDRREATISGVVIRYDVSDATVTVVRAVSI